MSTEPWRALVVEDSPTQAEQLRSLILHGQYPPGSKLPPERELSKRLRVNRASLREALKKLEHLGLVRIRQGDGTRVQNFMETGGIELVQHLLPLASAAQPGLGGQAGSKVRSTVGSSGWPQRRR